MERVLPIAWSLFGASVALAVMLPKPGSGGAMIFVSLALLAYAACGEVFGRGR